MFGVRRFSLDLLSPPWLLCFLLLWAYTYFLSYLCSVAQVWNIQFPGVSLWKQMALNIYQDHLFWFLLFSASCLQIWTDRNTLWDGQRLLTSMLPLQSEPNAFISVQIFTNWLWASHSSSLPHVVCMCWVTVVATSCNHHEN